MITHPTVLNLDAAAHRYEDLSRAHRATPADLAPVSRLLRLPIGPLLRAIRAHHAGNEVPLSAVETSRSS